ncbi:hypothetical protein SEA_IZZY_43 [Streptomyces phage Izzy]|uniref:Helix-turn-helix DNA binding domain protein n=6 Tax=Likavirus izzy TaxID=1982888 RepID=A0A2U8UTS8_9CAUD|nr:hypothetical protein AVT27_gp43 [Streptomyces phage Izzy]ATE84996.1 hypothetical protein SEA_BRYANRECYCLES_43 [Streptomyces phage BryanRecycles]ATE85297.1 hypothetical protein SEA_JASH_43 [Streptomyces phage Jash]ATE85373.1 hypothetical protein SEA_OLIYNYK_43 [Streptomyces phage Oliynyk]AWN07486.1 hypothetical protein SEA_EDDASA_43 [Streptomyces phage Eddasa]QDK03974.1 hypothetical protein SEA_RUSTICUS_43 [Streptomyces phage Rusticus]WJN62898.1 hypothetical protein [Streptomyces phage phiS
MTELPGSPGPSLEAIWGSLTPEEQEPLAAHLLGETSADWLSTTLRKYGHDVSATTIRVYRRSLRA